MLLGWAVAIFENQPTSAWTLAAFSVDAPPMRIALANLPFTGSIEAAVTSIAESLNGAAAAGATILCTPENFLPGLRNVGFAVDQTDASALRAAHASISQIVKQSGVALILGSEFIAGEAPLISALVYDRTGKLIGRQDKVQLDPSENGYYAQGRGRCLFEVDGLRFGIAICHEAWRYPETVRWAAMRGAQLVFVPHLSLATSYGAAPAGWADPRNSFHEKAAMCRAAENSIYIAIVNYAVPASETTSAVINPDGSLLAHQPHGEPGLLIVDIERALATGFLAARFRPQDHTPVWDCGSAVQYVDATTSRV